MSAILQTENLTKIYGPLTAVNSLNLTIEKGDIMGFIGPNGAGKTTTIRMVSTLLKPTSGTAFINGIDVSEAPDEVRKCIGYMPDFFGVYDDVKVWEYLDFFAAAYRIPKQKRNRAVDDVLELTDLTVKKDFFVEALSRGMKQRLCLAKTLLHDPKLLLLDEPASGLDPRARIEIKELLKELRAMGKTILISSHILPELADFCNKVAIIERGELIVSGDVSEIVERSRGCTLIHAKVLENIEEAERMVKDFPDVKGAQIEEETLVIQYAGEPGNQYQLLNAMVKADFKVISFSEAQVDLEDVFMKVTRGAVA